MSPFSRAMLAHRLSRLSGALASIQGEVLATIAEAQPPVRFDGPAVSPLVADLLELNSTLTAWHHRLKDRRSTSATQARIERNTRRPR